MGPEEDLEGKGTLQEEGRALHKVQRWGGLGLWNDNVDTGPEGVWERRRGR